MDGLVTFPPWVYRNHAATLLVMGVAVLVNSLPEMVETGSPVRKSLADSLDSFPPTAAFGVVSGGMLAVPVFDVTAKRLAYCCVPGKALLL